MSAALALALVHPPHAVAAAAAPTPSDMSVCFLYGFTWFYGLKLFLKHLFSPILFFLGSMFLLTRMGVLPESLGREAYAAYVEPYVPKEWKDPSLEVVDDWVKTAERKFWAFVKDDKRAIIPSRRRPSSPASSSRGSSNHVAADRRHLFFRLWTAARRRNRRRSRDQLARGVYA